MNLSPHHFCQFGLSFRHLLLFLILLRHRGIWCKREVQLGVYVMLDPEVVVLHELCVAVDRSL